jgi:hypothetical protein
MLMFGSRNPIGRGSGWLDPNAIGSTYPIPVNPAVPSVADQIATIPPGAVNDALRSQGSSLASRRGMFAGQPSQRPGIFGAPLVADTTPAQAPNQFADLIGPAPVAPKHHGFDWQMALAALGAALQGDNRVMLDIAKQRRRQQDDYKANLQRYQAAQQFASLPGMTARELETYMVDPKAWAAANATRYQAATLGEKDTRVYGNPQEGGSAYQAPRLVQNGVDTVQVDPMGAQPPRPVYSGTTDAQQYARGLGLDPGTAGYNSAQQDYVLRGNGPTAYGNDLGLEAVRQQNRMQLHTTPTYAQTHPRPSSGGRGGATHPPTLAGTVAPILAKMARGEPLTAGEQTAIDTYYHRGGKGGRGGRGSGGISKVATNPQTGEKVGWNGSAWVPVQ